MDPIDLTDEQLQEELAKRKTQRREVAKPGLLDSPDLSNLQKLCQGYIDKLARGEYCDEDYDHWVYEEALTTLFGEDVWDWIRNQLT